MRAFRSHIQLVLVAAVGAVAAAATGFFPVRPPQEDRLPNRLTMQIASPRGGTAMALHDRFAGYQERYYAEITIKPATTLSPLEIPLPAGQIIGLILRVRGVDGPAPWWVDIGDVRVQAEDGARVHSFTPDDVAPGRNVARVERGAGGLHVEPVAGADAVELELKFGGRMVLPDDSPEGRAAVQPVVFRQRRLAALLVLCGLGVTLLVKRHRATTRATTPVAANDVPP